VRALVVVAIAMLGGSAFADAPAPNPNAAAARSLFKKGIEEYQAKKWGEASITLLKSYELDPKPDTLFALAQAERFDGRCADALEHYKKLLEQTTDLPTGKAVQSNMDLCAAAKPIEKCEPTTKIVEGKTKLQTKTVTRDVRRTHKLATGLIAGGALSLGGSVALFMLSRGSLADSDKAITLDESNRLYDRSVDQRRLSFVFGGAGLGLVGAGVVRILTGKPNEETSTQITVGPTRGGAGVLVMSRW
jgi:tetratricopeptide (TPR) repeat protein